MDTRTGEISKFPNQKELEKAQKDNPFLIEVNCPALCEFGELRQDGKTFCIANRKERRKIKYQIKRIDK